MILPFQSSLMKGGQLRAVFLATAANFSGDFPCFIFSGISEVHLFFHHKIFLKSVVAPLRIVAPTYPAFEAAVLAIPALALGTASRFAPAALEKYAIKPGAVAIFALPTATYVTRCHEICSL